MALKSGGNIQNKQRRASYNKSGFPSIKKEIQKGKSDKGTKRAAMVRALVNQSNAFFSSIGLGNPYLQFHLATVVKKSCLVGQNA